MVVTYVLRRRDTEQNHTIELSHPVLKGFTLRVTVIPRFMTCLMITLISLLASLLNNPIVSFIVYLFRSHEYFYFYYRIKGGLRGLYKVD